MEQNKPLIWIWNKKPVDITKIDDKQLFSIKKSINNSANKVWFGSDSKVWISNIDRIVKDREFIISKLRQQRLIDKATESANLITYGILKCFKNK